MKKIKQSPSNSYQYVKKFSYLKEQNIQYLTTDEITALFNLPLSSSQVTYLQNMILQYQHLTIENLSSIPENLEDKIQTQQQQLNDFFSQHVLNTPHSKLVSNQEQEQTLISRL